MFCILYPSRVFFIFNAMAQKQSDILTRIARIEGQLKGIRRMVEEKKECLDIITQISAIREAVAMLGVELLKDDITCKWEGKKRIDEAYLKSLFKMQ